MRRTTEDKITRTVLGITIAVGLATPAWSHIWGDPHPCVRTEQYGPVCVVPGALPAPGTGGAPGASYRYKTNTYNPAALHGKIGVTHAPAT